MKGVASGRSNRVFKRKLRTLQGLISGLTISGVVDNFGVDVVEAAGDTSTT
jgi:hypothetical protein